MLTFNVLRIVVMFELIIFLNIYLCICLIYTCSCVNCWIPLRYATFLKRVSCKIFQKNILGFWISLLICVIIIYLHDFYRRYHFISFRSSGNIRMITAFKHKGLLTPTSFKHTTRKSVFWRQLKCKYLTNASQKVFSDCFAVFEIWAKSISTKWFFIDPSSVKTVGRKISTRKSCCVNARGTLPAT